METSSDDGVDVWGDSAPESIKAFDNPLITKGDVRVTKEELDSLSPEAIRLIGGLRRAHGKKSRSLAEQRKAFEKKVAEFEKQRELTAERDANQNKWMTELLAAPEKEKGKAEPVAMTQEWFEARIQEEVQKRFGVVTDRANKAQTKWEEAQKQKEASRLQGEVAALAAKEPDFDELQPDMVQIAKANPALNFEQVIMLARANKGTLEVAVARKAKAARTTTVDKARERTWGKVGGPASSKKAASSGGPPKGMTAEEEVAWWKNNQGAVKAMVAGLSRFPGG